MGRFRGDFEAISGRFWGEILNQTQHTSISSFFFRFASLITQVWLIDLKRVCSFWFRISPQNRPRIAPKSPRNRLEIAPKSSHNRPGIAPKSPLNRPIIAPWFKVLLDRIRPSLTSFLSVFCRFWPKKRCF